MIKNIFFWFLWMSSPILIAQSATERMIYLDSTFEETNQINHKYYRIISDFYKTKSTYKTTDYYKSGRLYSEGYSTENHFLNKTGNFHYYYENGNKKEIINYENSIPLGLYFSWYEDGNKQLEGEYLKSEIEREIGTLKIDQFWNSQNEQTVTNGNGYFDLSNNEGCEEGTVVDGMKNGIWAGTNHLLKFTFVEKYVNGRLSVGVSTDENAIPHIYRKINIAPEFPGGINQFYQYVGKNFQTPNIQGLKGKVFISFFIETNGSLDEIKIVKSLGKEVDLEAYRIISECPDWKSAVIRGIKKRIKYKLPINIQSAD